MSRPFQALLSRLTCAIQYCSVAALIGFSLQAGVQAQAPGVLKLKENDKLLANGDCAFQYEIKLPAALYTSLKRATPNTAVLIRKLGLSDQSALIEGQAGEWVDGESTLKISFCSRGVARIGKADAWELP